MKSTDADDVRPTFEGSPEIRQVFINLKGNLGEETGEMWASLISNTQQSNFLGFPFLKISSKLRCKARYG